MKRRPSVQTVHLSVDRIEDRVVTLVGGQHRAILDVGSVNFGLAGEVEREGIVASYAAFLNSLTFPIQVLVRVRPIDLDAYVADLEHRAQVSLPEALAAVARDHAGFLRRLARQRTLLERRFYVVVPADANALPVGRRLPFQRHGAALDDDDARRQLTFRCEEVERQLSRCGLAARRLGDIELAQLLYACWCPEQARVQRLRRHLTEYTTLVTRAARTVERRS